jgi:para-aminobenzoate synthetase component 1
MTDTIKVFSKEAYMEAVRQVQRYISQGDVFQVNLSVRQDRKLQTSPEHIYECLRLINPSPYMGLIRFPELSLVSGSPELLVRLVDGVLETRPIAGTRPRGGSAAEDMRLADELIGNEKERAEHVMLVDLLRNDLGRISRYGTVKVDEFMVIEYYSHVMHIVSNVRGQLAEGKHTFDAIAATFPGGTITGAPKVRTMEIIDELEPVRRGPYTGSIGWIDYNGNMELNIIIRTMVVQDGIGQFQAGAGIVIDSVPELEYTESLNKAKALWKAIQFSESVRGAETR